MLVKLSLVRTCSSPGADATAPRKGRWAGFGPPTVGFVRSSGDSYVVIANDFSGLSPVLLTRLPGKAAWLVRSELACLPAGQGRRAPDSDEGRNVYMHASAGGFVTRPAL